MERLSKLLAMTESPNENEAAMALKMAQRLAIENKIDLASVGRNEATPPEEMKKGTSGKGKRFKITQRYVNWILRDHFNVYIVLTPGRVHMIGTASDVDFALYVCDYLNSTMAALWTAYRLETSDGIEARTSFYYGLYNGLDEKLKANKRTVEVELLAATSEATRSNYGLAVRNAAAALTVAVHEYFPRLKKGRTVSTYVNSSGAYGAGAAAGARININRAIG